jgi:regulatory protein
VTPERSTITAIEPQVRRPDRVSIFVDGAFALGMHAEAAAASGVRVGQQVSLDDLRALVRAEELRCIRESALHLLGYRARSRRELERRLLHKGFEADLVSDALDALARAGLIDDAEFSRSWVRARTSGRPMGPGRIAAELRQKGVERELIDAALAPVDEEAEIAMALSVGRQKVERLRGVEVHDARRKLSAALMRRGFSWEIAARVTAQLLPDDDV